jgi:hypothetical protein
MRDFRLNPDNPHEATDRDERPRRPAREPLSGSKNVKNRNHSRANHGEGS